MPEKKGPQDATHRSNNRALRRGPKPEHYFHDGPVRKILPPFVIGVRGAGYSIIEHRKAVILKRADERKKSAERHRDAISGACLRFLSVTCPLLILSSRNLDPLPRYAGLLLTKHAAHYTSEIIIALSTSFLTDEAIIRPLLSPGASRDSSLRPHFFTRINRNRCIFG